jgi:hypothetical protein
MNRSAQKTFALTLMLVFALAGCGSDDPASPGNSAPTITAGPGAQPATISAGETTILTVTATDADGDDLTYTWSSDDGTFTGTGSLVVYTPDAVTVQTVQSAQVVISDGNGGSVTGTVDVTVNPTVVVGATYRVRLNSLFFADANCDGIFDNDVEAYWNIQALTASAVRVEGNYVQYSSGMTAVITTGWAEADVLDNGTGAITISGTVSDYDDVSGNDLIGRWNLGYNASTITEGTFNVSGGNPEGEGCTVVLNFTIERLGDVYGAP